MAVLLVAGGVAGTPLSFVIQGLAVLFVPVLLDPALRWAWLREPAMVLFSLAFIVLGIAFIVTANQLADVRFLFNFLPLILAVPLYVLARRYAGDKTIIWLLGLSLAGALCAALAGLYDAYVLGLPRAGGFGTNPIVYARMALLLGLVASTGFFILEDKRRFLFLLGPVFGLVGIYTSDSRGSLLAVPLLLAVFIVFILTDRRQAHRWWIAGAAIALAGLGAMLLMTIGSLRLAEMGSVIEEVLKTGQSSDPNVADRLEFYRAGWQLFIERPIFGYGWADMYRAAFTIIPAEKATSGAVNPNFHFHNDFINFAVSAGVIGLFAYAAVFAAPIVGALASVKDKFWRPRLYLMVTIVVLHFITGLPDITIGYDIVTVAYAFIVAAALGAFRESRLLPAR